MKKLEPEEIIALCSKMVHTTADEVGKDKYKNACFINYLKELVLKYGLEGGIKGGELKLKTFEENVCHPLMSHRVWSMQGIAYIYLAKYNQHSLGTMNGINLLDIFFIPQKDEEGNLLRDKEDKVITVVNPSFDWFLEPEGFNLWINWVNAMFNPVKRKTTLSSPNDLLSQLVNKKKLITEELTNSDIISTSCNPSDSTKERNWILLEQCYKAPSSNVPKT